MLPAAILFLAQLLLWLLLGQINHALTPLHVALFTGGLFVSFAAFTQPLRTGLAVSFFGGLLFDTAAPVPFGTHALLFAAAHALVFHLRDRVPRDETTPRVVIALLANLSLFLVFSFLQIARSPAPAAAWPRLFADLACSQIFLALVAPWFFALQARTLSLAGLAPSSTR